MNDSNRIRDAFAHYRYRRAYQLLEGDSDAHWVIAYQHADELIDFDSFEAAWVLQESTITSQRQELARVGAERDGVQIEAMTYAEQRDTAQAQLAEAIKLLGWSKYQLMLWEDYQVENGFEVEDHYVTGKVRQEVEAFLAGHAQMPEMTPEQSAAISHKTRDAYVAQAEQQEAPKREVTFRDLLNIPTSQLPREEEGRGAQAGLELVGYANYDQLDNMLDDRTAVIHPKRSGFAGTAVYRARAALATQPAVLPVDPADWPLKVGADEFVRQQADWPDTNPSDFMHDALYEMIRVLTQPAVRGAEQ